MSTLRILVDGRERLSCPYSAGQAWALAGALERQLPALLREGRAVVTIEEKNVAWIIVALGRRR